MPKSMAMTNSDRETLSDMMAHQERLKTEEVVRRDLKG
jgi:hypothetical protein